MIIFLFFFFFKQKTAYEMRISDWSSDVCSSDLTRARRLHRRLAGRRQGQARGRCGGGREGRRPRHRRSARTRAPAAQAAGAAEPAIPADGLPTCTEPSQCHHAARSEEHTSELQSLMRKSYAVFCLKKKKTRKS